MPNTHSTKRIISPWILMTAALLVVAILFVVQGGLKAVWLDVGHVSVTQTTTTRAAPGPDKGKKTEVETTKEVRTPTFWDILGLVFIPLLGGVTVVGVGYLFNKKQREREEAIQALRAQDAALQQYLDQMSDLLINRDLRPEPEDSEPTGLQKYLDHAKDLLTSLKLRAEPEDAKPNVYVRDLAKARTVAVLLGLDSEHKRRPLKLIYELELIKKGNPILKLGNAGLEGANLSELTLHEADLTCADLRVSDLKGADLEGSNLNLVDLRGSDLRRADLKVLISRRLTSYHTMRAIQRDGAFIT